MAYSESGSGDSRSYDNLVLEQVAESDKGYAFGPERALLVALLFDGVQSFMNYALASSEQERTRHKEAFNWVRSKDSAGYIFSFDSVCEALGIDPRYFRYGLLKVYRRQPKNWRKARRNF